MCSSTDFILPQTTTVFVAHTRQLVDLPPPRQASYHAIVLENQTQIDYFRAVKKALRAWKLVLGERTGFSRLGATSGDPVKIKERDEDLELDRSYRDLTEYLRLTAEKIENGQGQTEEGRNLCIMLVDDARNIQALSIAAVKASQLYVRIVITAPWNLKMNATVPETHQELVVRGAGTAMMLALYQIAQAKSLTELRLKPMDRSYTFYKDTIAMQEDTSGEFFYSVVSDQVPVALQAATDRLSLIM